MKRSPLRARSVEPPTHRVALSPSDYTKFKAALAARADYRCENPACRVARGPFDVHHVIKRSQGGADRPENCVYLCRVCHAATDEAFARGRLVVTARGDGTFDFAVVTKRDKWAPDDDRVEV